jgi:L,D-transpeptidase catalytic domain
MPFLSKKTRMFRSSLTALAVLTAVSSVNSAILVDNSSRVIISVRDQKLMLVQNGIKVATYQVSTSRYGLGDAWGSMATPLGLLQVAEKIGDHAPFGAVFHNRRWTGEVLRPNTPGRDPIMTRIIWLRGLEAENAHAYHRCIYIHGTNEEKIIGRPASFGCIRMRSTDVTTLYNQLPIGAVVQIVQDHLPRPSKVAGPSGPSLNALAAQPKPAPAGPQVSGPRA